MDRSATHKPVKRRADTESVDASDVSDATAQLKRRRKDADDKGSAVDEKQKESSDDETAGDASQDGSSGKVLDKTERRRQKKERKKLAKMAQASDTSLTTDGGALHNVYGANGRADVELKTKEYFSKAGCSHIKLKDVQDLVLWVAADGVNPRWVFVKNKPLIPCTVVVGLPGLDTTAYTSFAHLMPTMMRLFSEAVPTRCPGGDYRVDSHVHALLHSPLSKQAAKDVRKSRDAGKSGAPVEGMAVTALLVSAAEMHAQGYPSDADVDKGYV
eukprot:Opistho-2@58172